MSENSFRFLRSEEFFALDDWQHVVDVSAHKYSPDTRTLSLSVTFSGDQPHTGVILVQVPRHDVLRVRFNPDKRDASEYSPDTVRSQAEQVATVRAQHNPEGVTITEHLDRLELRTTRDGSPYLVIRISYHPYSMEVWRVLEDGEMFPVFQDDDEPLRFRSNDDPSLGHAVMSVRTKPATARYTGFGEHGGGKLFKETVQHNFFNYDNYKYTRVYGHGPTEDREPLYHSAPFFLELNAIPDRGTACGVFLDNPSQTLLDVGTVHPDQVRLATRFGDYDQYLFVGDAPAAVLHRYSQLVDHARLKPRWALGYHQGCYGYDSRAALEAAADTYRDPVLGLPIDGLHIDVDIQHNYQTFTVDPGKFPEVKDMFGGLRGQGYKCSTNITPIISDQDANYKTSTQGRAGGHFVTDHRVPGTSADETYQQFGTGNEYAAGNAEPELVNNGEPYRGEVNYGGSLGTTGNYPDFGRAEVRQWWGTQYQDLFDAGLEMVWQDMTTPAVRDDRGDMLGFPFKLLVSNDFHGNPRSGPALAAWNLYSYNLHKATYEGLNQLPGRENRRNFVIGRGSTSGTARYAALWTGDNASTWDFLRISVPQMLALGVSGQPMAGADVGGFETGTDNEWWADPALLIRWTAAAAFSPWFRNHYTRKGSKRFQEPWAYDQLAEDLYPADQRWLYKSVLPICRYYVGLRYRLMQVFYDAMFANLSTGQPICRPLFLVHPQDTSLLADNIGFQDSEFMLGNDILVAPVLDPEDPQAADRGFRDVYLPSGTDWFSFKDGRQPLEQRQPGGTTVRFDAHLSDDPQHQPFTVPVYIRAGAVLPMLELEQYVGQRREQGLPHPITFTIYPGAAGSCTSYLDDGISRSSAPEADPALDEDPAGRGEYRQVTVSHRLDSSGKHRYVSIERDHDGWTPPESYFYLALAHDPHEAHGSNWPISTVTLAGSEFRCLSSGSLAERAQALQDSTENAWYYDESINTTMVKVIDPDSMHLTMTYAN